MESSNMKLCTYVSRFTICSIILCIGIWEATIASSNQDLDTLKSNEVEAYVFTTIKSIINIITSLVGYCLTCTSNEESSKSKSKSKSNADSQISMINLGVSIWGIVMYTNMKLNSDIYGPFRIVIYIEFIIMMIVLSLFGFIIIMSCCACIIMPFITNDSSIKDNITAKKSNPIIDNVVVDNTIIDNNVVIDIK